MEKTTSSNVVETIRRERNLTIMELADEIGVTIGTAYNMALGRHKQYARNQHKLDAWLKKNMKRRLQKGGVGKS